MAKCTTRRQEFDCPLLGENVTVSLLLERPMPIIEGAGAPASPQVTDCTGASRCSVRGTDGRFDSFRCAFNEAPGLDV